MEQTATSHSEEETMAIARGLAGKTGPGDVIGVSGNLGAGKTRFVKGFAEAFGISSDLVNSPTFALIHEYQGSSGVPLYHFDFFRLERPEEALEIGAEEYFYGDGVSIIEWPGRIRSLLPETAIHVTLRVLGEKSRLITIKYPTEK